MSQKDLKYKKPFAESFENKAVVPQRLSQEFIKRDYETPRDFSSYFVHHSDISNKYGESSDYKIIPHKHYRNIRYKFWMPGCLQPSQKHKRPTDKEIMELLYRMQITVTPPKMPDDTRKCMFCQGKLKFVTTLQL